MDIKIQTMGFTLTSFLQQHVEKRILTCMSCYKDEIQQINVRLLDTNGPKGGVDKCCRLQVIMRDQPTIVVEDVETDLYFAITRAAERAGRTVKRKLGKQRDHLLSGSHKHYYY